MPLINDTVLDSPIDKIIADGDKVFLLEAAGNSLTWATVLAAKIGEFVPTIVKADNELGGGGRKGTISAETGVVISTGGGDKTFDYYAVVDEAGTTVLYVGDGTNKVLGDTDTVSTPAFAIRFNDGIDT